MKRKPNWPDEIQLRVTVDGKLWDRVKSFKDSSPKDKVYVAKTEDNGTTVVTFGEGVLGRRPHVGSKIAAAYRYGLGKAGRRRRICFDLG